MPLAQAGSQSQAPLALGAGRTARPDGVDKLPRPSSATPVEPFRYRMSGVLGFPSRLFRPVAAPCPCAETHQPAPEVDTDLKIGKPRTFAKTPANKIALQDVLQGRHLPPLTRDEFTNYLLYEERSAENWYFVAWLEGYTKQYQEWLTSEAQPATTPFTPFMQRIGSASTFFSGRTFSTAGRHERSHDQHSVRSGVSPFPVKRSPAASQTTGQSDYFPAGNPTPAHLKSVPFHLSHSFYKALEAFFTPGSHFQLNLNADIISQVTLDAVHSQEPSIFKAARAEVEVMLNASLNRYLREIAGNAGIYRSRFAVWLGVFVVLAGFIPFILAIWYHWNRAIRLVCLPLFFFGTLTTIGGLKRTCIVIFLFGAARQLRLCEMDEYRLQDRPSRRPAKEESTQSQSKKAKTYYLPNLAQAATSLSSASAEKKSESVNSEKTLVPSSHSGELGHPSPASAFGNALDLPTVVLHQELEEEEQTSRGRAESGDAGDLSGATYVNPWEELEAEQAHVLSKMKGKKSVPVFAGLTKVLAPQILLQQRAAILRGVQYGLVIACFLGAIVMAVPNVRH